MPELPEVEHICRYLRGRVVGARIGGVTHLDWPRAVRGLAPPAFRRAIAGARIASVARRAKLVLLALEDGRTLAFHLMMTGKLWAEAGARPPEAATRAIFQLDWPEGAGPFASQRERFASLRCPPRTPPAPLEGTGGPARELRFEDQRKFGWMALLAPAERERLLAPFGPDALAAPEREIAAAYAARRGRAKSVLLDQRVVAGIGNIYADEILFAARVHPAVRLERLAPQAIRRLARATRAVMARALARREGEAVPDQKRVGGGAPGVAARLGPQVYQRTGEPCPRCGAAIERVVLGGRATHYCPRCQSAGR